MGCDRVSLGIDPDKSLQHDQELKGAISHLEGCLPLMASCDVNIVVASMEVELGVATPSHCLVGRGGW